MRAYDDIRSLMNQYCFTIDTGDFEGFARLFADGEWCIEGGVVARGAAQLLAGMANVRTYGDGTPRTRHVTSNIELTIDEAGGTAKSQCYVTVLQQAPGFALQVIFSGHYFDDFVCVDDRWRFKRRLIRHTLVGDMSAHVKAPVKLLGTAAKQA